MVKVLPSLLLLLALSSEGTSSPTTTYNGTEIVLVKKNAVKLIKTTRETSISVAGKPEDGFQGLLLQVIDSDDTQLQAWLLEGHQCLPQSGKWQHMKAWCTITNKSSFSMGIVTDECQLMCTDDYHPQSFKEFALVAYGSSRWIAEELPDNSSFAYRDPSNVQLLNFSNCIIHPYDTNTALETTTPSVTASSPWVFLPLFVLVTTFLLVALVVVVVMFIVHFKRKQQLLLDAVRFHFQSGHHDDHSHKEWESEDSWMSTDSVTAAPVHPSVTESKYLQECGNCMR
ncbi:hypothetical protein O3P69_002420 [Scylla paramamosain]|uniref:Uncharacterized protein n=1 Tax=Scylla paramamosain TaxID=85552 RepID=A0AAW0V6A8_SCYPA